MIAFDLEKFWEFVRTTEPSVVGNRRAWYVWHHASGEEPWCTTVFREAPPGGEDLSTGSPQETHLLDGPYHGPEGSPFICKAEPHLKAPYEL